MITGTSTKDSILVIDDSEAILDVIKLVLEKKGYQVFSESHPGGIINFVQNNKINLLLLDVLMRGKDGRDICRQLKSNPLTNYFPIILMSAAPEYLHNFIQYGADDILEKPFDINHLTLKINSTVASY